MTAPTKAERMMPVRYDESRHHFKDAWYDGRNLWVWEFVAIEQESSE